MHIYNSVGIYDLYKKNTKSVTIIKVSSVLKLFI